MDLALIISGTTLVALAIAHSVMGETGFIRPLVAADWSIAELPRWAADRLARAAWHLTSVAWLGLAAIVAGVDPLVAVGLAATLSGVIMFALLRAHGAWPLFLVAGLSALLAADRLPSTVLTVAVLATIALLVAAAGLHGYWAAGGRWGIDAALPTDDEGEPHFTPGPLLTLAVAGALLALAGLLIARLAGADQLPVRLVVAGAAAVLTVRAIGDGRQAGFSKSDRSTRFAELDDRVFTPLVVGLAFGSGAALLV